MYNRLLLAALEEPEDSGTTQKEDEDTSQNATMHSNLNIVCVL